MSSAWFMPRPRSSSNLPATPPLPLPSSPIRLRLVAA